MQEIESEDKKRLFSNFFSLLVLQGANYVLPLITFPYLVQVLGVDYFGLLAFATAIIAYLSIITDYGFNLTATREISIHRDNKEKVVEIFSSVMTIKFILMILSFILLSIIIFSFEKFSAHWEIYFFTFATVLGQVLFPVWFFQGMESMKYISYLNIVAKSIFTLAIFIFVKEQSDFYLVPLLTSAGFIIAGLWSLVLIRREFRVEFRWQSIDTLKEYLIDGWHIFISRIYVNLYTTTNIILLGVFTNNTAVGYYSIAEKIVVAIGGLFEPANQTIFPYLARKYRENFNQFVMFVKKIGFMFLFISSFFVVIFEYFKESIIYLVTGSYNLEVSTLLGIFLLRVLSYPFGALFSNSLIIMNRKKEFMRVMNYTVLLDLLIVPLSIYLYQEMGLVISFVLVLFVHVSLLLYYLNKSIQNERVNT
jgi:PST family polysaccharide transporter